MESYLNEAFLAQRRKHARWGSYIGLGALVVGLFTTTRSPLMAYGFLVVGLIAASYGSYMANRYVREPRADQVLDEVLDGLDRRYAIYHYFLASHHVVACHYGLVALLARPQNGQIVHTGRRWQHRAGIRKIMQLFGEPSLGKPDHELRQEMAWTKEWVDEVLPEAEVPVHGAVIFTHADVELHADDAPVPALVAHALPRYLKEGLKGGGTLSTARQKELRRILDDVVAAG